MVEHHLAAAHSLPQQDGKRIGRVKVRKLLGWDKEGLPGKARARWKTNFDLLD